MLPSRLGSGVGNEMQIRPGHSLGKGTVPTLRHLRREREESAMVRLVVKYWPALPILLLFIMLRWRFQNAHEKAQLKAFVNFSGYRIAGGEFVAVGLAPLSRRDYTRFHGCSWKDNGAGARGKAIPGKLKPLYPGEHHFLTYEALILNCKLRHPTDATKGGKLTMSIDEKTHLVYHEEPNAFPLGLDPNPPYKHHVVFCSPPVHSKVDAKRVYEWLEFHFHIGIDYVIIYDAGGITDDVLQTLLPYESQGRLEVRDIGEALSYESWLYAQVMVINDCAYSTRYSSKWTIFFDFDEFFNADEPPPPEKKQVQYLAQQQELNAAAHWRKQWERLQRSHHREEIAKARRELVGGELVPVRRERTEEGVYEPMAHSAKYSLEERKNLERSEEEEQRQRAIKLRQDKNYSKVKKKRKEMAIFQKNPSVVQKKRILMDELRKQQQQLGLIKAHREHLKAKNEAEKLLPLVLDSYEEASYISFGTLWWDVERCVLETEAIGGWAVQRMLYHWPHIYCMKSEWFPRAEACLDYHGHRKYAVNPRKVTALQIHRPEINDTAGFDLDTSVAKVNHFQGIVNLHSKTCTEIIKLEDDLVWWARGHEISSVASRAQLLPTAKFAGYHYPEEIS